jgi:hypothetical protein
MMRMKLCLFSLLFSFGFFSAAHAAFYLADHRLDFVCHQREDGKNKKVPCGEVLDVRAVSAIAIAATNQLNGWISKNTS